MDDPIGFLRSLFNIAVATADPMQCVPAALPPRPAGRVVVVGAGKASARMAEAVEQVWGPCEGLVITRDGYARPCAGIEIVEAAHPIPDHRGLQATERLLRLLDTVNERDFVLALLSGGGSALLVQPAGQLTLADKQAVNAALLASGAPIGEMNIVRKHLSAVKGGKLAARAWPAQVLSLIISDVPGDELAAVASGPTAMDASTSGDALAILRRYRIQPPPAVAELLGSGCDGPQAPRANPARVENRLIATPNQSLEAAATAARAAGCDVRVLGDAIEGEARAVAAEQAGLARDIRQGLQPGDAPVLLLSGGECTVTRRGNGIGGPNAEFSLSLAIELGGLADVWAMACDTDGVDGAAEVAGAMVFPDTLEKAAALDIDPQAMLADNAAHKFFGRLGDQVVTGPTLTNVNDFRAVLIQPPAGTPALSG